MADNYGPENRNCNEKFLKIEKKNKYPNPIRNPKITEIYFFEIPFIFKQFIVKKYNARFFSSEKRTYQTLK